MVFGGLLVMLSNAPLVIMIFFATDIFLTFYFISFLLKELYKTSKFKKEHKELIEKAREELTSENAPTKGGTIQ